MKELMILAAKLLPEDSLLDDLIEAATNYKADKTKENRSKLGMFSILISTRFATEGKDAMDVIGEMDTAQRGMDLLKTTKS